MHWIDSSCVRHDVCLRYHHVSRKKPGHEIDGGDGHAHAKKDAGEDTFRTAFPEGEGQAGDDDGDEGETARDGTGERLLQNVDGVFPGRIAGRLRQHRGGKSDRQEKEEWGAGMAEQANDCLPSISHKWTSIVISIRKRQAREGRGVKSKRELITTQLKVALNLPIFKLFSFREGQCVAEIAKETRVRKKHGRLPRSNAVR